MKTYVERPVEPLKVIAEQMKFDGTIKGINGWSAEFKASDYLVWLVPKYDKVPALHEFPDAPTVLAEEEFNSKYTITGPSDSLTKDHVRTDPYADLLDTIKQLQKQYPDVKIMRL